MASCPRFYLNSSFEEKNEVKAKGAKWDREAHKWYVPPDRFVVIYEFNKWIPGGKTVYLNCPYEEKEEVKAKGAKWDRNVKCWYVSSEKSKLKSFTKWLPIDINHYEKKGKKDIIYPDFCSSKPMRPDGCGSKSIMPDDCTSKGIKKNQKVKKEKKNAIIPDLSTSKFMIPSVCGSQLVFPDDCASKAVKKNQKVKNKTMTDNIYDSKSNQKNQNKATNQKKNQAAGLPRITSDMTKAQLEIECRARNPAISGLSTKNKDWFLHHLVIGSVCISHPTSSQLSTVNVVSQKASCTKTFKSPSKMTRKDTTDKVQPSNSKKRKLEATKPKKTSSILNLSHLPRITKSLTIPQLSHELHQRQTLAKETVSGLSNKPKEWFLNQLGIGSIWTTSMEARCINFSNVPYISSSNLTIAQLNHELLERDPNIKGLSGKNKEWFNERLGKHSVWITGTIDHNTKKQNPSSNKRAARVKPPVSKALITNESAPSKNKKTPNKTNKKTTRVTVVVEHS